MPSSPRPAPARTPSRSVGLVSRISLSCVPAVAVGCALAAAGCVSAVVGWGLAAAPPLGAAPAAGVSPPQVRAAGAPDSTLEALAFLTGRWGVPPGDPALDRRPDLAEMAIMEAAWIVGDKAIRYREHVPLDGGGAELEGMIYWDPAQERIEYVAVAGQEPGQGRHFVGELRPLPDGRVEKVYEVFYRTAADTPAEELGGLRRRFREIWEPLGSDRVAHTLEWWHEGRWQAWAGGRYELVRLDGAGRDG